MELIRDTELDVRVEGEVLYPAHRMVPCNDAETDLLCKFIGRVIARESTVRYGRRGDRKKRYITVGFADRGTSLHEVAWGEGRNAGICTSSIGNMEGWYVAVRVLWMREQTMVCYDVLHEKFDGTLHRVGPYDICHHPLEVFIPDKLIAANAEGALQGDY